MQAKFHTTSNILSIQWLHIACRLAWLGGRAGGRRLPALATHYMRWIYFGKIPKKLSGFLSKQDLTQVTWRCTCAACMMYSCRSYHYRSGSLSYFVLIHLGKVP